jgi:outer membrane immunogenic protein
MKLASFVTTTALTLTLTSAAWADSLGEPEMEPAMEPMVEVAPAPFDWSGFYAGLSAGKSTGDFDYLESGVSYEAHDLTGTSMGVFAGYNLQSGNFVYGLELALQRDVAEQDGFPDYNYPRVDDAKLRLGYAFDNVMVYGFVGRSRGDFHYAGTDTDYGATGNNFGVGADMVFNENWLVGLEYINRELEGDYDGDFGSEFTHRGDISTFQLRVGYKF